MKPALKSNVYFVPTSEGMFFRARGKAFILRGPKAVPVVTRLLERLDGTTTTDALAATLPAAQRPLLTHLLGALSQHDMLADHAAEGAVEIDSALWSVYRNTLLYLQDSLPRFQSTFLRWRESGFHLFGDGHALKSAARALAQTGARHLRAIVRSTPHPAVSAEDIARTLRTHQQLDPTLDFHVQAGDTVGRVPTSSRVIHVIATDDLQSDAVAAHRASLRESGCQRIYAGGGYGAHGIVGPWEVSSGARWEDVVRRTHPDVAGEGASPLVCSMAGDCLAIEMLRAECGITVDRLRDAVLEISPQLEISVRDVLRAPGEPLYRQPIQSSAPKQVAVPGEPTSELEELKARLAPLLDPMFGIFDLQPSAKLAQIPLPHFAVGVRVRSGANDSNAVAIDWGLTPVEAGVRALRKAASLYASLVPGDAKPARGELIVHEHFERWREYAIANAVMHSELLPEHGVTCELTAANLRDPELHQLLTMLRIYGEDVRLRICSVPGLAAYMASVAGRAREARAIGRTPHEALREALGELCSARQYPRASSMPAPLPALRAITATELLTSIETPANPQEALARYGRYCEFDDYNGDPCFSAAGLHVGYARLERLAGAR